MGQLIGALAIGVLLCCATWWFVQPASGAPATIYSLFLPLVAKPADTPCANPRKGIIGLVLPPSKAAADSYSAMGVCAGTTWHATFSKDYATSGAYPLPFQPINFFRSVGGTWFHVCFGVSCGDDSQAGKAAGAVTAVSGAGPLDGIYGNEPDNDNPDFGDNLTPAQFAAYYRVVSDTLKTANPSVRFVFGNFLWANTYYFNDTKASFAAQNGGADIRQSITTYGWHLYGNVSAPAGSCSPPYTYAIHAACVLANIDARLYDITATMAVIDADKPIWITEFGPDSTGQTSAVEYAKFLGPICQRLEASPAAKYFLFLGTPWQPAINASALNADHTLSPVGIAYRDNC